MAQMDDDMLNIIQSSGDGDMHALAACDGTSSANQSSISVASDVSSPVLLLRTRTTHHANGGTNIQFGEHVPLADDGVDMPIPTTNIDASLTNLDPQPVTDQVLTPRANQQ